MTADSQRLVVDASVAVKWIVPELDREQALALLQPGAELLSPDFILVEATNTFAKKLRRGELDEVSARTGASEIAAIVALYSSEDVLTDAFEIAVAYGRSVYDALYVALARDLGCQCVTADERLYNALSPHLPGTMVWLRDVSVA